MLKLKYEIQGYRYAPESFHAFKRFSGQQKNEIPLSYDQRHTLGMLYLTNGVESAVAYAKQIDRQLARKRTRWMTYGFMLKEQQNQYVYCPDLRCKEDETLVNRFQLFGMIRKELSRYNGRLEQGFSCTLDGNYRPCNVKQDFATVDFDKPIIIWLIKE